MTTRDLEQTESSGRSGQRPTLGVVAICRNEEVDLPGFLGNFLPWTDEIILVDEFSTDATVRIAESAGPKVRVIQRRRDQETGFAGQRNAGIAEARADWLLNTDIDFRAPPALAREILSVLPATTFNAFRFRLQNFFLHRPMRGSGWHRWNKPWLARRKMARFASIVHEDFLVDGGPAAIGQLQSPMWHLNDDSYSERLRKSLQYCELEAQRIAASGRRVRAWDFVVRPAAEIARKYLYDRAYRDGVLGLILAIHSADAVFRANVLAWDEQHRIPRSDLETAVRDMWRTDEAESAALDQRGGR